MRTVSGPRNRIALLLGGLLMMLAAAWIASASTPLLERWPAGDPVLPHGDSLPADIATHHAAWLLPTALALSVVAAILGIALLLAQIPTGPTRATLRITDAEDHLLGSLDPGVLERALREDLEGGAGVDDAAVHLGGSTASPWVQVAVTLSEHASPEQVAEQVRRHVRENVETVLGASPAHLDLLVRVRSREGARRSSPSSAEAVVTAPQGVTAR